MTFVPRRQRWDRTVYAVAWDAAGIVKIGFTVNPARRLRSFCGARTVLMLMFPHVVAGYNFEIAAHRNARRQFPAAFTLRADAVPYLSGVGDGYRECYQASPAEALELLAAQCDATVIRRCEVS